MASRTWDEQEADFVPYAQNARRWHEAGWVGVLPLAPDTKHPPPEGFTGKHADDPTPEDIALWMQSGRGNGNTAIRVPDTVVGVDVDDYGAKAGGSTFEDLVHECGGLPMTWTVTSRRPQDMVSGIRLFRVREGLLFPGSAGRGIEIVQRTHRYFVAPGSRHPLGRVYGLYDPSGRLTDDVPRPEDLPELPEAWIEALMRHVSTRTAMDEADGRPDPEVLRLHSLARWAFEEGESRHDTMLTRTMPLLRLEFLGYPGVSWALKDLHELWMAEVTKDSGGEVRTPDAAEREWDHMIHKGRDKIASDPPEQPTYQELRVALQDYHESVLGADPEETDDPGEYRWVIAADVPLEAPQQRIADRAPAVGVMQCYGMGDAGKTYIMVDAALSIEYGIPFMGRPTKQGRVGFVSMERPDDLVYRAHAWGIEHERPDAPSRLRYMRKPPLDLASDESVNRLREWIEIQGGIDVLIIDTQSKATSADEDNNTVMTEVMARVSRLSDDLQCLIVLVAHTGWSAGHQRGASTQMFSIDTAWKVERANDTFTLEVERLKTGTKAPRCNFTFKRHQLHHEDGSPLMDWFGGFVFESVAIHEPLEVIRDQQHTAFAEALVSYIVDFEDPTKSITKIREELQRQQRIPAAASNNERWEEVLRIALETGRIEIAPREGRGGGETIRARELDR